MYPAGGELSCSDHEAAPYPALYSTPRSPGPWPAPYSPAWGRRVSETPAERRRGGLAALEVELAALLKAPPETLPSAA
jgi:hypothetical protein